MSFEPGELGWLVPYLILAVVGMILVLAEAFFKGRDHTALGTLAAAGCVASAIASIVLVRQLAGTSNTCCSATCSSRIARATCCRRCSR